MSIRGFFLISLEAEVSGIRAARQRRGDGEAHDRSNAETHVQSRRKRRKGGIVTRWGKYCHEQ